MLILTMIDVIIPVYKPTEYILSLLLHLKNQTQKINKVIIINTEKKYWDNFFGDFDILEKYPFIELHHITKDEFDHGKTRNLGISYSNAEYFLLMTDDAVPDNEYMVENMLKAFSDPKVGTSYARQLPHKGCHAIEKYTRSFNYPSTSLVKGKEDIETITFYYPFFEQRRNRITQYEGIPEIFLGRMGMINNLFP